MHLGKEPARQRQRQQQVQRVQRVCGGTVSATLGNGNEWGGTGNNVQHEVWKGMRGGHWIRCYLMGHRKDLGFTSHELGASGRVSTEEWCNLFILSQAHSSCHVEIGQRRARRVAERPVQVFSWEVVVTGKVMFLYSPNYLSMLCSFLCSPELNLFLNSSLLMSLSCKNTKTTLCWPNYVLFFFV